MAKIAPQGRTRYFDENGAPLSGGKLYTYEAGTSTPKTTYTDKDAGTPNANPVILDSQGYADIWLDTGGYKFILYNSNNVEQWSVDDLDGGSATGYASVVISKSSGFNLTTNEQNNVIICTQALTVSLLGAAIAGDGFSAIIINTSSGDVTIDPDGSETINGYSTLTLSAGSSVSIHTNGTDWFATTSYIPDDSILPQKLAFGISGIVVPYAGSTAPTGWLFCAGQAVSRTTYADLFAVIGTTYGVGDGSSTFNVPDLKGRAAFGKDDMGGSAANRITNAVSGVTGTTLGSAGGSQLLHQHTHTVNITDPGHTHTVPLTGDAVGNTGGSGRSVSTGSVIGTQATGSSSTGITATAVNAGTGSSQNIPPAIVLNYIIKT